MTPQPHCRVHGIARCTICPPADVVWHVPDVGDVRLARGLGGVTLIDVGLDLTCTPDEARAYAAALLAAAAAADALHRCTNCYEPVRPDGAHQFTGNTECVYRSHL